VRRIGVLSDTHGQLRDEALRELEGSELILHAGDVGDLAILDRLRDIAPVWAVRGNTDFGEIAAALPLTECVDLMAPDGVAGNAPSSVLAYVLHGHMPLDLDPGAAGIRLVVSGHTHLPHLFEEHGVLYLNPGSIGPRRFDKPVSLARVDVEGEGAAASISARIIDLSGEV